MQNVRVTLTVDLAELMMQVGESLKGEKQSGEGFSPLTTAETLTPKKRPYTKRKVFVTGAQIGKPKKHIHRGKNQFGPTKDRTKLWEAVKTVLAEQGRPMFPREVKTLLEGDRRFRGLLMGEPGHLIPSLMFYKSKTKNPEIYRVSDGYALAENAAGMAIVADGE